MHGPEFQIRVIRSRGNVVRLEVHDRREQKKYDRDSKAIEDTHKTEDQDPRSDPFAPVQKLPLFILQPSFYGSFRQIPTSGQKFLGGLELVAELRLNLLAEAIDLRRNRAFRCLGQGSDLMYLIAVLIMHFKET